MKLATFNINNINRRLPVLLEWLEAAEPDVVCLQELKATDLQFPQSALAKAGYGAVWKGQSAWNGVAILARGSEPVLTRDELPGDDTDREARYIEAAVSGILVACLYAPNGNPQPGPKFEAKLAWTDRLIAHAADLLAEDFGLDSGAHLDAWIRDVLGDDADSTFADVRRRHGTDLVVCVTELRTRRAEYFAPDTHGGVRVALALRMSCGVPLAFAAVRHGDGLYVDGALRDNFPVAWARERSTRVLGIRFRGRETLDIRTPADYLMAVCECAVAVPEGADRCVLTIRIPVDVQSLDLGAVGPRTLRRLFNAGARQAREYVKKML